MALDICSTNQCPTLIRKGLITKSLWQYPSRNPSKCQKPLDQFPEKKNWLIKKKSFYSYGHLLVITGYKWDYTFYKWGYKYL